jgi:hypothetical protein
VKTATDIGKYICGFIIGVSRNEHNSGGQGQPVQSLSQPHGTTVDREVLRLTKGKGRKATKEQKD